MQITSALNLTLPIRYGEFERPDPKDPEKTITVVEPIAYAYHTPIDRAVFEKNHRVFTAAYAALWGKGLRNAQAAAAAGTAALLLLDVAKQDAEEWELDESGGPAILAEIARRTIVLVSGPDGFEPTPVEIAIAQGAIDKQDWVEAESAIVFFTCGYWGTPRVMRERMSRTYASAVLASITSSSLTEFVESLKISTPAATSAPSPTSSVPS